jgi:hypothetical protein
MPLAVAARIEPTAIVLIFDVFDDLGPAALART